MIPILHLYFELCLFQVTPDRVPTSRVLFLLTLLGYWLSGLILVVPNLAFSSAAGQAILDALVLLGVIFVALSVFGRRPRFQQAATAMLGSGILLNLIALPLVFWLGSVAATGDEVQAPSILLLILMVWSLLVFSHIVRAALDSTRMLSMALAVTYFITSVMLNDLMFPVT